MIALLFDMTCNAYVFTFVAEPLQLSLLPRVFYLALLTGWFFLGQGREIRREIDILPSYCVIRLLTSLMFVIWSFEYSNDRRLRWSKKLANVTSTVRPLETYSTIFVFFFSDPEICLVSIMVFFYLLVPAFFIVLPPEWTAVYFYSKWTEARNNLYLREPPFLLILWDCLLFFQSYDQSLHCWAVLMLISFIAFHR